MYDHHLHTCISAIVYADAYLGVEVEDMHAAIWSTVRIYI
jgi:hypothetical protein